MDELCAIFDAEAERQETLLTAMRAQAEAARSRAVALLEERTLAVSLLIEETIAAETRRLESVRSVVTHLGLPAEDLTLSRLIAVVPQPWKRRMAEFQDRIRTTLEETRGVVRENKAFLRRTARAVTNALETATHAVPERGGSYTFHGDDGPRVGRPSLLDQQG